MGAEKGENGNDQIVASKDDKQGIWRGRDERFKRYQDCDTTSQSCSEGRSRDWVRYVSLRYLCNFACYTKYSLCDQNGDVGWTRGGMKAERNESTEQYASLHVH